MKKRLRPIATIVLVLAVPAATLAGCTGRSGFTGGNRRPASRPQRGCRYHDSWICTADLQVTDTVAAGV